MSLNPTFTIYNASAGSGKTFTLVKEYLKILFKANHPEKFKNILAITFTNKAVAEMKERIVGTLKEFSNSAILTNPNSMFTTICSELDLSKNEVHNKSKNILNAILFNYAAFDISTIDGFTHRVIRTFAHDLKLPLNFEVELDQASLLTEAVDSLIAKAGTNDELTKILIDFAIEKADDDKSWDVSFDFNKIAKLLVNENDIPFIQTLKNKTFEDFNVLKKHLKNELKHTEDAIAETAKNMLQVFENANLNFSDFTGKYLPKHLEKLAHKNFNVAFEAKWQNDIENTTLYPKRVSNDIAITIDNLQPQIATVFNTTKQGVHHLNFLKNFYKNITPLSVLNAINNELDFLKTEQNKMLISEFNAIISTQIKQQPTPFIYERLGEKFKHYFIDEFQDTSVKQWENLTPLLSNALAAENGSTMLVGDAKQAIYRWRGGKAEQFIGLINHDNPFFIEKTVKNLPTNYRSFHEIVTFNNNFFTYLSKHFFASKTHQELYLKATQNTAIENNGYVEMSFLDFEKDDNRNELYSETTLNTINKCLKQGFSLSDICILVRKGKEGVAIANYLSEQKIPIVSSETLLLNNAPEIIFIVNFLKLLTQPNNNQLKVAVLNYLTLLFNIENKHEFFSNKLKLTLKQLLKSLEKHHVFINTNVLQLPLYDLAETIVRSFNLAQTSNAYIQYFLDIVLEFSQKKGSDLLAFISYFEKKKDKLSIISPEGQNAVKIMTIHKSKGLEFPVVIFPFADLNIYKDVEPKEWFKINKNTYNGFDYTLLNYNKNFEFYGEEGLQIHNKHQTELELDNLNLLYVAQTRAVEQLYIISKKDINGKGEVNTKTYAGLFINYLQQKALWNNTQLTYSFGEAKKTSTKTHENNNTIFQNEFISTAKETHNIKVVTKSGFLWDTKQQEAIEKGNLVHNIMAQIKTINDVDNVINNFLDTATINNNQAQALKKTVLQIVNHPLLASYFNSDDTVYNERDIITKEGIILRPDRLNIKNNNNVVIIDYKTGAEHTKHAQQLQSYQDALQPMHLKVTRKLLVYVNKTVTIKEINTIF